MNEHEEMSQLEVLIAENETIRAEIATIRAENTNILNQNTANATLLIKLNADITAMKEKERKKRKLCVSTNFFSAVYTNFFSATFTLFLPLLARKRAELFSHICGLRWDILILTCSLSRGKMAIV